jgi:hypothetical protein
MASERDDRIPWPPDPLRGQAILPLEAFLRSNFPVHGELEWLYLPPRSVSGLRLARAFPLEDCPLALGRGRLVAREGQGRIYLVDGLKADTPSLPPSWKRSRHLPAGAPSPLSHIARRGARLALAYGETLPGPVRMAGLGGPGSEILASLYYLVVLCGCEAFSLVVETGEGPCRRAASGPGPSGAGDPYLSSRCRIVRPCPRPAVSSSARRVPS